MLKRHEDKMCEDREKKLMYQQRWDVYRERRAKETHVAEEKQRVVELAQWWSMHVTCFIATRLAAGALAR